MYIHGFEGSWFRHPFWRARFVVTDQGVLDRIRTSPIDGVIIDTAKGKALASPTASLSNEQVARSSIVRPRPVMATHPSSITRQNPDVEQARKIIARGKQMVKRLFEDARLGNLAMSKDILDLVDEMSSSIERNRTTLINIARLKTKDEYTYLHSVAVSALMMNFARQLGMDADAIRDMGVAGLFHDVGKMMVSNEVLNKAGRLSDAEFAEIKAHTTAAAEMLSQCEKVPPLAIDVAQHHHERIDGTGYPHGLTGDRLSIAARMGAICDIYDALTSERAYKDAWTPAKAITRMTEWTDHLDQKLLFSFMLSIGLFPPGMLVRLRSNRLGVILPNGRRASRPKARAFYSIPDAMFLPAQDVTLSDDLKADQAVSLENPLHWPLSNWMKWQEILLSGDYTPPVSGDLSTA